MHFELSTKDEKFNNRLSFMIVKNPKNIYKHQTRDGREVIAKFDNGVYKGFVINENNSFLRVAKLRNLHNYVHPERTCVSPYNLKMFDKVFSSVIRGNNQTKIESEEALENLVKNNITGFNLTDDEFFEKTNWTLIIGPMYVKPEHVKETFEPAGLNVEFNYITSKNHNNEYVYDLKITTNNPMSLTEFLQKSYILTYNVTLHINTLYTEKNMTEIVEKFANFSKGWINDYPLKNNLIKRLSTFKPEVIEKFTDMVKDDVEDIDEDEEVDINKQLLGLHEKRHEAVIKFINKINSDDSATHKIKSLMDMGSSTGKFLRKLIESETYDSLEKYIAIDKSEFFTRKIRNVLKGKYKKRVNINYQTRSFVTDKVDLINNKVKCYKQNILYPYYQEEDLHPDCLALIEVIEHFDYNDRVKIYRFIRNYIKPVYLVFTTPNREYNVNYGMGEGEVRHRDHKVEFTVDEFRKEITDQLGELYDIEIDQSDESLEPSIMMYCTYKEDPDHRRLNIKFHRSQREMYADFFLPAADFNVRPDNIESGFCSNVINNANNIFYISPTMAPVEWTNLAPEYMEHPLSAFQYYAQRLPEGHTGMVQQRKYMGSRAYILVFKTTEIANAMGFENKVTVNSNAGFPFFNNDDEITKTHIDLIHNDIYNQTSKLSRKDFMILDAEFLPWGYKSEKSCVWDYTIPLFCELGHISKIENFESLFQEVTNFNKEIRIESSEKLDKLITLFSSYIDGQGCDMQFRVFNVLAYGNVNESKNKYVDWVNNHYSYNHREIIDTIHETFKETNKILKPVETRYIEDIHDVNEIERSVREWEIYCEKGGEGFVYKPMIPHMYMENGYPIQPALKVRGPKYLEMVYGPYYMDYLDLLKSRFINKKRSCAIIQNEVSKLILQSFLKNDRIRKNKFIAAFQYISDVNRNIDATL